MPKQIVIAAIVSLFTIVFGALAGSEIKAEDADGEKKQLASGGADDGASEYHGLP